MALPKFHNDPAYPEISIGVVEFACIGCLPPHDHPHVYLAIERERVMCPYCSTMFRYQSHLGREETSPAGLYYEDPE
jgi:uncharacterized Zn-finger protein